MTAAQNTTLQIVRVIKAPRERVYAAWTDPAQLREWFGPEDVKTHKIIADAREGGEFRWDLTSADGEDMTMRGEFRELQPNRKIVFSWRWEDDEAWENHTSVVTVEFSDAGNGTRVTLTHEQLPNEQSRNNHEQGWNSVFSKLENFFSEKKGG